MQRVEISAFPAEFRDLIARTRQNGESIDLCVNGEVVATLRPLHVASNTSRASAYGDLKDTIRGPVGDLIAPVWDQD